MSSGESDEEETASLIRPPSWMAGVLFGNIDSSGRLRDSAPWDSSDSGGQVAALSQLGVLDGQLSELLSDSSPPDTADSHAAEFDSEGNVAAAADAVDFSDISELAEELDSACSTQSDPEVDYDTDEKVRDSLLMPPPASACSGVADASEKAEGGARTCARSVSVATNTRRLPNTPLGAMLPEQYSDVDVTDLFPDFRQDKVLRFSRLFGPGKSSMLPQPWKNVRRRRRRKRREDDSDGLVPSAGEMELKFGPPLSPRQILSDDEEKLMQVEAPGGESGHQQQQQQQHMAGERSGGSSSPKPTDWRHGPSQLWYDLLGWPDHGQSCDYGFKVKTGAAPADTSTDHVVDDSEGLFGGRSFADSDPESELRGKGDRRARSTSPGSEEETGGSPSSSWKPAKVEDDAFLMVTQLNWEEDVIWNGDDIKHKVLQKLASKSNVAGWLPSGFNRTAGALSNAGRPFQAPIAAAGRSGSEEEKNAWFSMFPVENEELVYGRWEDDVIFDPEAMEQLPRPRIVSLDPNDENIVLGIPDDVVPNIGKGQLGEQRKIKIPHPHVRKSKILLGKAGVITHMDEDTPPPTPEPNDKDPFNISNDEFYMAKTVENSIKMGSATGLLQHSIPVVELQAPFVPTHMGPVRLRQFHRPPMKRYSSGVAATTQPVPVQPLHKHIRRKAKQREQERLSSGGGEVFFMRTAEDLTGKDGEIIIIEYCEEHPPCLSLVGMCSKLKNYYKRKAGKDPGPPELPFGDPAIAHTSPFLGIMPPGRCIQAVENNLYRSPIYPHRVPETDFLLIRTRHGYSIRESEALFVAGQQCPLYEVPGPNSKRANNFTRDFLQVFIYRLFWKSNDIPRRIKMEVIKRGFPHHSESSIRKRLKPCADFKRTGVDSNWWVIKPEFRLPTEDELRAMVSPEQTSAHFSMVAAEQRLRDAGYGERFLLTQGDDDDADLKIDDEIKMAPWNTTRAYIQAVKGKCLLQLTGVGDPTGCGEGFSYIRVPNKPTLNKEEQSSQPKRIVTGTDADLRRLPLANAKALLKNFGVPDEEIKKLSRWEVIDVVRTLSTEKAKAGEEGMDRFSRGNRFSIAEHQERYKEECQRLFELQNRVLGSDEVLSTDEGSSTEDENDDDIEVHGKNIENMLSNKKTSSQLTLEKEERERQELRKIMMGESTGAADSRETAKEQKRDKKKRPEEEDDGKPRVLKITRTFCNADGGTYTRVETVRKQAVIEAYLRIRNTKDEVFIKQFAGQLDDVQKEEMKREKRRIQEQLRRIKRNQERERLGLVQQPRSRKPKLKPDLNIKCGACGQVGHMRTNKACPRYQGFGAGSGHAGSLHTPSLGQILADTEDSSPLKLELPEDDQLVNIDGTKIKLSGKVVKHAEELKRKSMVSGGADSPGPGGRKRRRASDEHCDYLHQRHKTANRQRIDPLITFSTMLETILNEMRDMPDVQPFLFPVNIKTVPDYYNIVQRPMDLQTIRENLRNKKYLSREDFLSDVSLIVDNSSLYNGTKSVLTLTAQKMRHHLIDRFAEKEEKLMRLEKAINPLLDDDDQVGLSYILERIINDCVKTMQESWPFLRPVSRKLVKDYYDIIKNPIDIETIEKKVKGHKYHSSADFVAEFELLLENCVAYNGKDSSYSQKASALVEAVTATVAKYADDLATLEANISAVQQRAIDNAEDVESLETGSVLMDEDAGDPASGHDRLIKEEYSDDEDGVEVAGATNVGDIAEIDEPMLLNLPAHGSQDDDGEDVDPSYDPEAFLYGLPSSSRHAVSSAAASRIHSDLQISESEGEDEGEYESGAGVDPDFDSTMAGPGTATAAAEDDDDEGLVF